MKRFYLFAITAFCVCSCSTVKMNTAKTMDTDGALMQIPVVAELDVAPTKESLEETNIDKNLKLDAVKNNAIAQLLKKSNADVLIEPRFELEYKGGRKIKSLIVTGFPAKYKKFRSFQAADSTALKANLMLSGNYFPTQSVCVRSNAFVPASKPFSQTNTKQGIGADAKLWYLTAEAAYAYGLSNDQNSYSALATFGYSISNYFGVGAGLGLQLTSVENTNFYNPEEETSYTMPLYVNLRGDMTNNMITPYWSVNAGYNIFSEDNIEHKYIADLTVGVKIYGALVGLNYSIPYSGIGVRLGYCF